MQCNNCLQGQVLLGEHFVTRDMALDAGQPELEGRSLGVEWGQCPCCMGVWQECGNCSAEPAERPANDMGLGPDACGIVGG